MGGKAAWRRWSELIAGIALMILAPLVLGPTAPGPAGLLGFALGLALVLRNSRWAKRRYVRFKRRWPRAGRLTDRGLRRPARGISSPAPKTAHDDGDQRENREADHGNEYCRVGQNA